jgi:hypothetical protein
MRVGRPEFDFSQTPARRAKAGRVFGQMNKSSLWISCLEHFLDCLMAQKRCCGEMVNIKADLS